MSNRTNSSFSGLMPIESLVPLLIAYILTTTLAVCGNSLVIVVFSCGKRSRSDLRGFLINLAVADLVMAIFCTPFTFTHTIMNHWPFSNALCPLVLYMQLVSGYLFFLFYSIFLSSLIFCLFIHLSIYRPLNIFIVFSRSPNAFFGASHRNTQIYYSYITFRLFSFCLAWNLKQTVQFYRGRALIASCSGKSFLLYGYY